MDNIAFKHQYLGPYNIVHRKSDAVNVSLSLTSLNASFRRSVVRANLLAWQDLVSKVKNVELTNVRVNFRWLGTQNGIFTVFSMYRVMADIHVIPHIWKLTFPVNNEIFIWYMIKGVKDDEKVV